MSMKRLLARLYSLLEGLRDRFWVAVARWEHRRGKTIPLDEVVDEAIEEFLDGLSVWYGLLEHRRGKTVAWEEVKTRLGLADEPTTP